jgi:hypothetical protein
MDEILSGAPAPVAEVPAASAAPAPGATAAPGTEAPEGGNQPEPEKTLTQSEVNKLLAKEKARLERRVERAVRAEVERDYLKRQLEESRAPQREAPKGAPQRKDFESDEAYADAWVDYRVDQKIADRESKKEKETSAERQKREAEERVYGLQEKLSRGAEEFGEDFMDRVLGASHITEPMVRFFEESDLAHKVANELVANPAEAARIAKLSPIAQIRELDKLEAKLKAPPKTTQAPAPIVPSGGQAQVQKDYKDMGTAEHIAAWRNRRKR